MKSIIMPIWMLFFTIYFLSFMVVWLGEDWIMVWIGLELNMLSFLMMFMNGKKGIMIESFIKYFIIQSMVSALFLGFIYMPKYEEVIYGVMLVKMGIGPFYFWYPKVVMDLEWFSIFVLMVFQKLLPLYVLSLLKSGLIWIYGLMSMIVGCVGSFNQYNFKLLLAYSSIYQGGWLLMSLILGGFMWLKYLMMYMLVAMMLMISLMLVSEEVLLTNMSSMMGKKGMVVMINLLSLGGIPPFLGFIMKLILLQSLMYYDVMIVFVMVLLAVIMMYIYIRLVYFYFLLGEGNKGMMFMEWNGMKQGSSMVVLSLYVQLLFMLVGYMMFL